MHSTDLHHNRARNAGGWLARMGLVVLALTAVGCHTSLRRPPALCQCLEDRCGDAVDCVGRTTSISNPHVNHRVTRHYRSHTLTRELGRCSATGGPHCFR